MATPYYTDAMRAAVAAVKNKHGFQLEIMQMDDSEGPYLTILIDHNEYSRFGADQETATDIAKYLVNVHKALRHAGARVTYLVVSDDSQTVEWERSDEEITTD